MSAVNTLVQRNAVHVMTDGLGYDADGVIMRIAPKCFAVPNLSMAVATMGAGSAALIFADELGSRYCAFDDVIAEAEDVFRNLYDEHFGQFEGAELSEVELTLAGYSESRKRPEAYVMFMCEDGIASEHFDAEPFTLRPVEDLVGSPDVTREDCKAALLTIPVASPDELAETIIPEFHLLHMAEIQRRKKNPIRAGFEPRHFVGGFALLTTITREAIVQRILHRWDEDQVGEHVEPRPIDWSKWKCEHEPRRHVPETRRRIPIANSTQVARIFK